MKYSISAKAIVTKTLSGYIILNLGNQEFYTLDEIGGVIWDGLVGCQQLESILDQLVSTYDVAPADAMLDVNLFLDSMVEAGLVVYGPEEKGIT